MAEGERLARVGKSRPVHRPDEGADAVQQLFAFVLGQRGDEAGRADPVDETVAIELLNEGELERTGCVKKPTVADDLTPGIGGMAGDALAVGLE